MARRKIHDILILTTVPHFLALMFINRCGNYAHDAYAIVVVGSSTLSVIWHWLKEPCGRWKMADYMGAVLWAISDVIMANVQKAPYNIIILVLALNIGVFLMHWYYFYFGTCYETAHAWWHVLSCAKCITVASIVGCRYKLIN